jgi:rhodanese-related sulfurtransferase
LNSEDNRLDFGDVLFPKKVTKRIEIENSTEDKIDLSLQYSPEYISVKIVPEILKPQKRGKLIVTFNSKDKKKYGRSSDQVKLNMKAGERDITGVLTVITNMVEDFSHLSEKELANSPIIYFPKNRIKLGEFKLHEIKKAELQFENTGKKDLKVHNIEISNNLFKLQSFDPIIKPGDKGKIVISVKPIQTTNNMKSNITVISNDPKHSSVTLIAQGSIKKNVLRPKIEKEEFYINEKKAYFIFKEFKGKDELVILDVRSKEEFENNHIPDAINIDFCNKNFYRILKLLDKSKIYLVYCKSGMFSEETVMMMKELDFERVHNMEKGIIGWEKSGYPLMK